MNAKKMKTLSIKKKCLLYIWAVWEQVYHGIFHVRLGHIDDLLYYRVKNYRGHSLQLNDGECINKGDLILELHFNNMLLLETALCSRNNIQMASILIQSMKETLQRMAFYIEKIESHKTSEIKALYGISILHKGAEQFGFNVISLPDNLASKWKRLCYLLLLQVVHPSGTQRIRNKNHQLSPKIIAISRNSFRNNDKFFKKT